MTTAARRIVVGTPESSRMWATSARERRCGESSLSGTPAGVSPLRYTIRRTPAVRACSAKIRAALRSVSSKSLPDPIPCTR